MVFWTLGGETPGMRLMALRVRNEAGDPPRLGQAMRRLVGTMVIYAPKSRVESSAPGRRVSPAA